MAHIVVVKSLEESLLFSAKSRGMTKVINYFKQPFSSQITPFMFVHVPIPWRITLAKLLSHVHITIKLLAPPFKYVNSFIDYLFTLCNGIMHCRLAIG